MGEVAAQLAPAGPGSVVGAREPMGWTPWGFWATAGLGLAVLAAWQGLQMLVAVPFIVGVGRGMPAGAEVLTGNPEYLAAATFASAVGGVALVLLFARRKGGSRLRYLAMRLPGAKEVLLWIVAAVVVAVAAGAVGMLFGRPAVPDWWVGMYGASSAPLVLLLAVALAAPLFEEALFRGLLFPGWSRSRLGATGTILLTTALWSAMHLQYDVYDMGQVFVLGLLLGLARHRSGSLVVPVAMHVAVNVAACVQVAYLLGNS